MKWVWSLAALASSPAAMAVPIPRGVGRMQRLCRRRRLKPCCRGRPRPPAHAADAALLLPALASSPAAVAVPVSPHMRQMQRHCFLR